jgi:EAL domain-containing protein (putative c-di-GMP-specific phosphodiesterase class I)
VEQLIAEPSLLGPDFTPIRRLDAQPLASAPVLGWKATGRGVAGSDAADALSLLEQAASVGLVERLDWAFRAHTFDLAVDAGLQCELHLTPEPETFGTPCPPRLAVSVLRGRRSLNVCAELHDDAFDDEPRLLAAVEEMSSWGWHTVIADARASGRYRAMARLLAAVRPAYVQIDLGAHDAPGSASLQAWLDTAREHGAQIMALGIDTQRDLDRAIDAGATYGRGALVGAAVARPR